MAHYAFVDKNNFVVQVIAGRDETETVGGVSDWEAYYAVVTGARVVRTSYNTFAGKHLADGEPSADQSKAFRKNYAGIGFTYDEARDAFIPPQPFDSWVLDEDTCLWEAPVPYPAEGNHTWDEPSTSWILTQDQ